MPNDKRLRQKEREQQARAARAAALRRKQRRRSAFTFGGLIVAIFAFAVVYSIVAGGGDDDEVTTPGDDATDQTDDTGADDGDDEAAEPAPCPPTDGSAERRIDFPAAPPDCLTEGATYEAVFVTDAGDIRVELDTEVTPSTTNNFVYLARYGYYDGTEMFRSNTGIDIIQGGSPRTNDPADPGPGYTIDDEGQPFSYEVGDLVMARTAAPNSASAQYFFSTGPDTALLNDQGTYVRFGRVIEGLDILEAIMATHVDASEGQPGEGSPDPKPVIETITIIES
ncbi:MAG: peptidylprolyl isomerase [Acidimicrobiales bacterium]